MSFLDNSYASEMKEQQLILIDKFGKKIKLNIEQESIQKIVEDSQGKHPRNKSRSQSGSSGSSVSASMSSISKKLVIKRNVRNLQKKKSKHSDGQILSESNNDIDIPLSSSYSASSIDDDSEHHSKEEQKQQPSARRQPIHKSSKNSLSFSKISEKEEEYDGSKSSFNNIR